MISWAKAFLVIALIAAALGFSGIAGTAYDMVWLLVVVTALTLAAVFGLVGMRSPHPMVPTS